MKKLKRFKNQIKRTQKNINVIVHISVATNKEISNDRCNNYCSGYYKEEQNN